MRTHYDLVLENGDVWTQDPERPRARSVGILDGMIVAVSDEPELGDGIPATRTIHLAGRTVLPGINDSHVHASLFGVSQPPLALDLTFPGTQTIEQVRAVLERRVAAAAPGEWIRGNGFDLAVLRANEGRTPTAGDLDAVSPDHPVILVEYSSHLCWVNSAALRNAGVTADTPEVDGGVVSRDADGRPTGIFMENAMELVERVVPDFTPEQIDAALRLAAQTFLAEGITSITDAALGPVGEGRGGGVMGSVPLAALARLAGSDDFPIRTNALLVTTPERGFDAIEPTLRETAGARDDERWFRIAGVKLFADGVPPSRTAYVTEDYCGGGHGALVSHGASEAEQEGALERLIRTVDRAGVQLGVHATGDRASLVVARALAAASRETPERVPPRHYVIHGDFLDAETLGLLAAGGFGINTQPAIHWTTADAMVPIVGAERAAEQWPLREILDAGVVLGFSSDAPITAPDWRRGVISAVTRAARGTGEVSGPRQRITCDEALAANTSQGAWFDGAEAWKGRIAEGMVADLCVLDGALDPADIGALAALPTACTIVDGVVRYERAD